ncbi:hypothetical protein HQ45_03960 [Porphyromonas crevioricanis]|nr:hypothetical protein HQ45_03960 [Porphyromonas crevioricanis]
MLPPSPSLKNKESEFLEQLDNITASFHKGTANPIHPIKTNCAFFGTNQAFYTNFYLQRKANK